MKRFIPALALAYSAMALSANAESCRPDNGTLLTIESGSPLDQKIIPSLKKEVFTALQEVSEISRYHSGYCGFLLPLFFLLYFRAGFGCLF